MIHLGGDEVVGGCWSEDKDISAYMKKKGLTISGLWKEWHKGVYDGINEISGANKPYLVYWNEAFENGNHFAENSIVHYWTSTDKSRAINSNVKVIQSASWYLDKMHPTPGSHYFF